jgi:hypothetical protein
MITLPELRLIAVYDPATGQFSRAGCVRGKRVGQLMGSTRADGYVRIRVAGTTYYAHRLVWLWTYGEWPVGEIDHIDGNPANNRISNLRDVSKSVNQQNLRKAPSSNKTALLGVTRTPAGRFKSTLTLERKQVYLGTFASAQEAHAAYLKAKRRLHTGCTI